MSSSLVYLVLCELARLVHDLMMRIRRGRLRRLVEAGGGQVVVAREPAALSAGH
ncbi:hypothetical protein ABZ636_00720 [Streptomyces sp. NPDC007251]|uniref:hypothetical protein n=1 Tax=unclassified Streptomyces TaxID=2593676 RepID=UPI0033ECBD7C